MSEDHQDGDAADLRDDDGRLAPVVADALEALTLRPEDEAAAALARSYAAAIDATADSEGAADVLTALGPKLLTALEALGATPRARAAPGKGGGTGGGPLAKLREKEAGRASATA